MRIASALNRVLQYLCAGGAVAVAGTVLEMPLIVTQVPLQEHGAPADRAPVDATRRAWFAGARLVQVSPGLGVQVLSDGFESACDPNVSFDGQRVLFAGRKPGASHWRIWELALGSRALRAVSPEGLDAWSPIHASTLFTLDSPEPWFTMVFVGAEPVSGEGGGANVSSLYNIKLDGTELRRMTFNPNRHLDPFQMWDGRVVYAAEHYPQEPAPRSITPGAKGESSSSVRLYAIHVEGADVELYGGERGGRCQQMPCATESGLVVFVEMDSPRADGGGQLACLDERRPHVTYRRLTHDAAVVFANPTPWRSNTVLVAQGPASGEATWRMVSMDLNCGESAVVFDSPEFHEVQAVPIGSRGRPDGHSTVVNLTATNGTFYGLNCYTSDPLREAHLPPGSVKRVRFIEGVLPLPGVGSNPPERWPRIPRRLVGEAPVEADGSFNVEVPADTPLLVQTLDERGLALGTCGWIWVKPKETRGCIGCHEDPERIPENEYVLALRRRSNRLLLPASQRRAVAFRQEIVPVLQRHCASIECHGRSANPLHLPLSDPSPAPAEIARAYDALLAAAAALPSPTVAAPVPGKYVDPGRARTSRLIWHVLGEDTSRPWDVVPGAAAAEARTIRQMPPPGRGKPLPAEDVLALIQWIDLGAQFDAAPSPASASPSESAPTP